MRRYYATITKRGQVTIPAEVRRLLGTKPRDKVAFEVEGGQVKLASLEFTLQSAYGSVRPLNRPEDFERLSRVAKEEHAARVIREIHER